MVESRGENVVHGVPGDLALVDVLCEALLDARPALVGHILAHIRDHGLEALLGAELADAGAHGAGTHNDDFLDIHLYLLKGLTPEMHESWSGSLNSLTTRATQLPPPMQADEAERGVAVLHGVEQGGQDLDARGGHGVAEGDGAAVDVDLGAVEAQHALAGDVLGGEGFVEFDEVVVLLGDAGLVEGGRDGLDRRQAEALGIDTHEGVALDQRHGLEAERVGLLLVHDDLAAARVAERAGVAGGDGAVLAEHRRQLGELVGRHAFAVDLLVLEHVDLALAAGHLDFGGDLRLELALLDGGLGLVVAVGRKLVLLVAGDVHLGADVLGQLAHQAAAQRARKPSWCIRSSRAPLPMATPAGFRRRRGSAWRSRFRRRARTRRRRPR